MFLKRLYYTLRIWIEGQPVVAMSQLRALRISWKLSRNMARRRHETS